MAQTICTGAGEISLLMMQLVFVFRMIQFNRECPPPGAIPAEVDRDLLFNTAPMKAPDIALTFSVPQDARTTSD